MCDKGRMMGHRVSHAKNRTNHAFKPNLQNKKITVGTRTMSVKICTNCIKLMKKDAKDALKKASLVASAPVSSPAL
jgi:large subunit ribosomal protein L28